ncbi:MAG: DUF6471 domain-containing protein [Pseudomonadota bacterium]
MTLVKNPPTPEARKSLPINAEYQDHAKAFLRAMIEQAGTDYEGLAEGLNAMGIEISARGVENKISRGGFSAAFLLQCATALGIQLEP